ncbi:Predicted PurR-regulated permease PerM [Lachnospiraceae bacterium G11]|nr:Predicted PurR-regulated permease PerM [Lachnospiraceae bacterium G11]
MKFNFNKKYVLKGLTAFLVLAAGILLWYLVFHGEKFKGNMNTLYSILVPILDGFIIAYIASPILNFIEKKWLYPLFRKVFKKDPLKCKKPIRAIGIILTALLFIAIVYGIIVMIMSQLIPSIMSIVNNFDVYTDNVYKWVNKLFDDNPEVARFVEENVAVYSKQFEDWLTQTIIPQASQLIKSVSLSILSFIKVLWNFIIGFIISIYLLASKETLAAQAKKILYAFCSIDTTNKILRETRYANKTFINFFIGKIIDSTIIGVLCFIGTSIMGIPYAALVSVIIGVTNIIPFFGPIIGAVPTALLILIVDISNPMNCVYYVIFVLILQQLDGNVIGPLILGESTGLSSFWIIFAIIFFGGLWDVFGMFVGVPLMAVIYSAVRRIVTKKLKAKELPEDTGQYMNVGEIDSNKTLIPHLDETGNVISGEIEDPMPSKKARLKRKKNKAIISIAHKTEEIKEALAEKKAEVLSKIENSDTENETKEENREDSDGN